MPRLYPAIESENVGISIAGVRNHGSIRLYRRQRHP